MLSSFAESPHTPQFFFFFVCLFLFSFFFFLLSFFFFFLHCNLFTRVHIVNVHVLFFLLLFFFFSFPHTQHMYSTTLHKLLESKTQQKKKRKREERERGTGKRKMHKCRSLRENATYTRTMLEAPRFDFFFFLR